jgi:hypothetical protein
MTICQRNVRFLHVIWNRLKSQKRKTTVDVIDRNQTHDHELRRSVAYLYNTVPQPILPSLDPEFYYTLVHHVIDRWNLIA